MPSPCTLAQRTLLLARNLDRSDAYHGERVTLQERNGRLVIVEHGAWIVEQIRNDLGRVMGVVRRQSSQGVVNTRGVIARERGRGCAESCPDNVYTSGDGPGTAVNASILLAPGS